MNDDRVTRLPTMSSAGIALGASSRDLSDKMSDTADKSPWAVLRKGWLPILKQTGAQWGEQNLSLVAAAVAFYTFLALTPLIAATVMTYGLLGSVETVERQMQTIIDVVPSDAATLIEDQLLAVVTANSGVTGFALLVALGIAIFGSMRAANSTIGALNIVNQTAETRGFIKRTMRAILLTLAIVSVALVGLLSAGILAWMQRQIGGVFGSGTGTVIGILTWLAAIALCSAGFALIMRFGPNREPPQWRWFAPGALLATLLWVMISVGFSFYVSYISDYSATYGSLSAIVVFLMWLFLSASAFLAGALLNSVIETHAARHDKDRPQVAD